MTSQVKQRVLRTLWSFPPVYGARIAARILSTPRLKDLWYEDLLVMSGRIAEMRRQVGFPLFFCDFQSENAEIAPFSEHFTEK